MKMNELCHLCCSLIGSVAILSLDEMSLSNEADYGYSWSKEQPVVKENPERRRERRTIFGAVDVGTGHFYSIAAEKGEASTFGYFLDYLVDTHKKQGYENLVIVLDNARIHHAKALAPFLEKHQGYLNLFYLPPYSPDLNPIERVWWKLRKQITQNRYVQSIEIRIEHFFQWAIQFECPNEELLRICTLPSLV